MSERFDPSPLLTKERAALLLFDALQGYLHPADPVKESALSQAGTLARMEALLAGARKAGLRVFFARGDHSPDRSDLVTHLTDTNMDLKPWPDPSQPFNSFITRDHEGARIAQELVVHEDDIMIFKHRWSAFFQTSLELSLRARGIDTVIIAGLSTDVGIASTVFAAKDLDFGIVVVSDACFSSRGNNSSFFMERVFPRMGRVMTTEKALSLMLTLAASSS